MKNLPHLVAVALLLAFCSKTLAQICIFEDSDTHGYVIFKSDQPDFFSESLGNNYLCGLNSCIYYLYHSDSDKRVYTPLNGFPCGDGVQPLTFLNNPPSNNENPGGGSEGGGNENPPNNGGGEGGGGEDGGGGGNGENPPDPDGGGSGDNDSEPPPNKRGGPEAPMCPKDGNYADKDDNDYWHNCYDKDGDYWRKDTWYEICDIDNDVSAWEDCFFGETYYADWSELRDDCEYEYRDYGVAAKQYCSNRFRNSNEARLYDTAVFGTAIGKNVTGGLSGNSTIDIGKKFGIGKNADGSLSSTIPDLLADDAPDEDGEFGVCLKDIEIVIFGEEIILPFSRVCPWLEHLGTIFLFLSLFAAIRIIYRG